jgi:dTDP-4-amino-4,6-dideoxygalactose transaminase
VTLPLVDVRRQYRSIKDELDAAIAGVLESGQFILGEEIDRFEREFADYCGVRECIGVGSGTAAIELALEALGVLAFLDMHELESRDGSEAARAALRQAVMAHLPKRGR